MRALVANCTMIALTVVTAQSLLPVNEVLAQRPRPGYYSTDAAQIQAAQYEEVVPTPAAELDISTEISNAIGEVVNGASDPVYGVSPTPVSDVGVLPPTDAPMVQGGVVEGGVIESSIPSGPNEVVFDTSFDNAQPTSEIVGQPYDIPVTDVIPTDAAEVYSTNRWFRGGTWYSKQEFLMLLRSDLTQVHLGVDSTAGGTDPFIFPSISSSDGAYNYEAGTRLTLGKNLGRDVANRDHSLEFTFTGLFEYTGRASLEVSQPGVAGGGIFSLIGSEEQDSSHSGSILIGFPLPSLQLPVEGFIDADRQEMLLTANFNSFEFNYVIGGRPARDRLVMQPDGRWSRFATPSKVRGFYMGLRYIRQNETFRYQSFGNREAVNTFAEDPDTGLIEFSNNDNDPDTPDTPTIVGGRVASFNEGGTYRVNTDNDLMGFQFGSDLVAKRTDWVFGLNGKLGGLLNFADRRSSLRQRFETTESIIARQPSATFATNDPEGIAEFETRETTEQLNDETLTFLGELNMYVAYYLRPNTSFRVGYNVLYMNGIAAALDNVGLQGTAFRKFEVTGDSFYHGMNLGLETTW